MSKFDKLDDFCCKINNDNKNKNLVQYLEGYYSDDGSVQDIKLVIYRSYNQREILNKIYRFCADNDIIIISTDIPTYTTIIRVKDY